MSVTPRLFADTTTQRTNQRAGTDTPRDRACVRDMRVETQLLQTNKSREKPQRLNAPRMCE